MIEIRYKDDFEITDIAGSTVAETRALYKTDLGIADKAAAFLNGKKITAAKENTTVLNDNDRLVFKVPGRNRAVYLAGALLLAIAVTGGIFASGFMNANATIIGNIAQADFAAVSANTSSVPSWAARGVEKSQTGSGTLFDISTAASGYTGDMSVTITLANTDELVKYYRSLNLVIEVRDSANNPVDINNDGNIDSGDFALLTLESSRATFSITQSAADVYTVMLNSGNFICHAAAVGWAPGGGTPLLYCEIAQR